MKDRGLRQCDAVCVVHPSGREARDMYQRGKRCQDRATRELYGRWFCWVHAATVLRPMARQAAGAPIRVVKQNGS